MSTRWLGVTVSGDKVTLVDVQVPDNKDSPIEINADTTLTLQSGNRPKAYSVMHQRVGDYARERGINRVCVKESAVSRSGTKVAHLLAAELRGVVLAALNDCCLVDTISKAKISRGFGKRKADEYIADDNFWSDETTGKALRAGSREAALLILQARK